MVDINKLLSGYQMGGLMARYLTPRSWFLIALVGQATSVAAMTLPQSLKQSSLVLSSGLILNPSSIRQPLWQQRLVPTDQAVQNWYQRFDSWFLWQGGIIGYVNYDQYSKKYNSAFIPSNYDQASYYRWMQSQGYSVKDSPFANVRIPELLAGTDASGKGQWVAVFDSCSVSHQNVEFSGKQIRHRTSSPENLCSNFDSGGGHGAHVSGIAVGNRNDIGAYGVAYGADLISLDATAGHYLNTNGLNFNIPNLVDSWHTVASLKSQGYPIIVTNHSYTRFRQQFLNIPGITVEDLEHMNPNYFNTRQPDVMSAEEQGLIASVSPAMAHVCSGGNGSVGKWYGHSTNPTDPTPYAIMKWVPETQDALLVALNFENRGSAWTQIGQPAGKNMHRSVVANGTKIYNTTGLLDDTNTFEAYTGTSMAAPIVSGLIAVLAELQPDNTATQLTDRVLFSAVAPKKATCAYRYQTRLTSCDDDEFVGQRSTIFRQYYDYDRLTHEVNDFVGVGMLDALASALPIGKLRVPYKTSDGSVKSMPVDAIALRSGLLSGPLSSPALSLKARDGLDGAFSLTLARFDRDAEANNPVDGRSIVLSLANQHEYESTASLNYQINLGYHRQDAKRHLLKSKGVSHVHYQHKLWPVSLSYRGRLDTLIGINPSVSSYGTFESMHNPLYLAPVGDGLAAGIHYPYGRYQFRTIPYVTNSWLSYASRSTQLGVMQTVSTHDGMHWLLGIHHEPKSLLNFTANHVFLPPNTTAVHGGFYRTDQLSTRLHTSLWMVVGRLINSMQTNSLFRKQSGIVLSQYHFQGMLDLNSSHHIAMTLGQLPHMERGVLDLELPQYRDFSRQIIFQKFRQQLNQSSRIIEWGLMSTGTLAFKYKADYQLGLMFHVDTRDTKSSQSRQLFAHLKWLL
ncbi:MAG: S8 family serine peptidase [Pseudomonadota bacterium]|nr:S8 family serine peptidase [Pseudomonadota bacterium]